MRADILLRTVSHGLDIVESEITGAASGHAQRVALLCGLMAAQLDFHSRLMACLDIYQAVSEERPYHPERSHADTMCILREMAGSIDPAIVKDINLALGR